MAVYTIEQWLKGMVDYDVPSNTIQAILFNNGIRQCTPVEYTTDKQRDLSYADLLIWLSSSSTATSGEYVSDGGWQHQKSNKNVTDRVGLRKQAMSLYAKWNSEKANLSNANSVNIKSLY